ncbi:thiol-disulfide oxidoreductase DCC family protein [Halomonas sp. AOP13-D3-9]
MSRYAPLHAAPPVTLFHDGHCPFCQQEVAWLEKHRYREHITLVDIQARDFNAHEYEKEFNAMMGQLHLRDSQGAWFIGMDASRALYAVLGYRRLVRLSCLPGLYGAMNAGYRFFARRRIRLGRWWEKRQAKRQR